MSGAPVVERRPVVTRDDIRIDTYSSGCGQWSIRAWAVVAVGEVFTASGKGSQALREAKAAAVAHLTGGTE